MTGSRTTGVWISADSATGVGWSPELTVRQRIDSTVPAGTARPNDDPSEREEARMAAAR